MRADDWTIRPVAMLVAATMFMENFDGTVISTAAPAMGRSFGVASSAIGLAITTYLVTVAALIPVSAYLADLWGPRTLLVRAILVFTGASVLCATSTSLRELAMMRVLQGVGGAMMVPVGRLVVMRNTGKADVIRAIAYLTWPSLLAPVLSPVIGGLLTQYASWHWIFLINVPLGIGATVAAVRLIERTERGYPPPLDWPGFISSGICLGCIVVVAALVGGAHVPVVETVSLSVLGVVSGLWAYRHLRTTPNPLVRFDALSVRTFRFSQTAGTLFKTGINAVPFVLPLFFQDGFGWTPSRSGATVMFLFVGNLAIKPVTTPLLRAVRFRTVLIITSLGGAITVAACALLRVDTPFTAIVALLVISGVFRSTGYTCFNTIAFADIDQSMMSQANTLSTTTQQLTNGFAVAVAVLSLKAGTDMFGHASGYPFALLVLAVIVVISMVMSMRLPANAGDTIRKVEEVDE